MKLIKIDRKSPNASSFSLNTTQDAHFLKIWHYHPELELVLILESTGTRFIGDSISKFAPGELVLLGSNLPHMWLNDPEYFEPHTTLKAEAIAIHFRKEFLGTDFLNTPEMAAIASLLNRAARGIVFEKVSSEIKQKLVQLKALSPFERTMQFLALLQELSTTPCRAISSTGYQNSALTSNSKNFDAVYEYLFKNFRKPIMLGEVAALIPMNPSAFSRLFSKFHKKSFTRYLNEIRIGYACRLLIEKRYDVSEICYACGFNSLSNFNRQFKTITGKTPLEYAEYHQKRM